MFNQLFFVTTIQKLTLTDLYRTEDELARLAGKLEGREDKGSLKMIELLTIKLALLEKEVTSRYAGTRMVK